MLLRKMIKYEKMKQVSLFRPYCSSGAFPFKKSISIDFSLSVLILLHYFPNFRALCLVQAHNLYQIHSLLFFTMKRFQICVAMTCILIWNQKWNKFKNIFHEFTRWTILQVVIIFRIIFACSEINWDKYQIILGF